MAPKINREFALPYQGINMRYQGIIFPIYATGSHMSVGMSRANWHSCNLYRGGQCI
jgi:hypothetical protein